MKFFSTAILLAFTAVVAASEDAEDQPSTGKPVFKKTSVKAPFLEQFTEDWKKVWTVSSAKKASAGGEDEDDLLLRYRGEWAVEAPEPVVIENDKGLVIKTAAAHHAISAKFPKTIDPKGKQLVVQYEVKLHNGLECGGAYLKLLSENTKFDPKSFDDKAPYTIMFGPDKCAANNKVHFIFRHKHPKTGVIEEKHLKSAPTAKTDKKTNLYTLIVNPDQTFQIKINNEESAKGSLLEDFLPSVNPPKEIDDPTDKKPADWVDQAKIPDPDAKKPADWDESAPEKIPDEDATQPADWLVDEPATVPDPDAEKPDDWDDEEDGEWVAASIPNPKCQSVSGCGVWTRPLKRNPKFKGIWRAPLIDNPAYKGVWKARKIPNPDYVEDKSPSNFTPISAIGFELWTMQDGIMFDNIYVGHSAEDAAKLATETWFVKHEAESAIPEAEPEKPESKKGGESPVEKAKEYLDKGKVLLEAVKEQSIQFITQAKSDPLSAIKELPHIAALFTLVAVLPILSVLLAGSGPKKPSAVSPKKKAPVSPKKPVEDEEEDEEEEEEEEEKPKVTKRKGGASK